MDARMRQMGPGHVVLACQGCPYAWEPGRVDLDDLAELLGSGCPQCGDWLWFGELAVPVPRAGELQ